MFRINPQVVTVTPLERTIGFGSPDPEIGTMYDGNHLFAKIANSSNLPGVDITLSGNFARVAGTSRGFYMFTGLGSARVDDANFGRNYDVRFSNPAGRGLNIGRSTIVSIDSEQLEKLGNQFAGTYKLSAFEVYESWAASKKAEANTAQALIDLLLDKKIIPSVVDIRTDGPAPGNLVRNVPINWTTSNGLGDTADGIYTINGLVASSADLANSSSVGYTLTLTVTAVSLEKLPLGPAHVLPEPGMAAAPALTVQRVDWTAVPATGYIYHTIPATDTDSGAFSVRIDYAIKWDNTVNALNMTTKGANTNFVGEVTLTGTPDLPSKSADWVTLEIDQIVRNVTVADELPLSVRFGRLTNALPAKVYNGAPYRYDGDFALIRNDFVLEGAQPEVTWAWKSQTINPNAWDYWDDKVPPTNRGAYNLHLEIDPDDKTDYVAIADIKTPLPFNITPRTIRIDVLDYVVLVGANEPDPANFTWRLENNPEKPNEGAAADESLTDIMEANPTISFTGRFNSEKAITYPLTASGGRANPNYNLTIGPAALLRVVNSLVVNVERGTANASGFLPGQSVTLTANADTATERFSKWTIAPNITPTSGSLTSRSVTFAMPNAHVAAVAVFEPILPTPAPPPSVVIPTTPIFNDVSRADGSTTFNAVQWAGATGIILGRDGNFLPNDNMTRASFAVILHRYAGGPVVTATNKFTDVKGSEAIRAVAWAHDAKIVTGASETIFGADTPITREQMVLMLYRFHLSRGGSSTVNRSVLAPFADRGSIDRHALDAMSWAVENKIVQGVGNNLVPTNNIPRAQVAVILHRYLG
jgi:hypothetical protein